MVPAFPISRFVSTISSTTPACRGADTATLLVDGIPLVAATTNNPIVLYLGTGAHTWQVHGYDKAGNSSLSLIRTFTIANGSATNPAPMLSSASFMSQRAFNFQFNSVPGQNYSFQFTSDLRTG